MFASLEKIAKHFTNNLQIQNKPSSFRNYKIHQGLILYKNHIWVGHQSPLCNQLLVEFHSTPLWWHIGITKTLIRLKSNFFRYGLRKVVQTFVINFPKCQKTKHLIKKPIWLPQPLLIPTTLWEDLSLDFVTRLPTSKGFSTVLVTP